MCNISEKKHRFDIKFVYIIVSCLENIKSNHFSEFYRNYKRIIPLVISKMMNMKNLGFKIQISTIATQLNTFM